MRAALLVLALGGCQAAEAGAEHTQLPELVVDRDDVRIERSCRVRIPAGMSIEDANEDGVLHVVADGVTLEFAEDSRLDGAAGRPWDALTGVGIRVEGHAGVTIRGARVSGYKVGILAREAPGLVIEACDVSDNFRQRLRSTTRAADDGADWLDCHHNEEGQWRARYGAGICIEQSSGVTVRDSRARRVQNGLILDRVSQSRVFGNDFSFLSGWGLAMWRATDNLVARNAFDFCIRGYSHGVYNRGQDSAGILVFEQCSRNVFVENSATHGGDGVFGFAGSEALGEAERPKPGFDYTRRGCNDNQFLRNDLSFAAAHGLELTFSFGNDVRENLFEGNAICGIWGGYSQEMRIQENRFVRNGDAGYGLERGGINIEHGKANWILGNEFEENACGVHLWWDPDEHLTLTPWALANGTGCEHNQLIGNSFTRDEVALHLRQAGHVLQAGNRFEAVKREVDASESELVELEEPVVIPNDPVRQFHRYGALPEAVAASPDPRGRRRHLRGRDKILMAEWGPWDHQGPFVQEIESAPDHHRFLLHQVEGPVALVLLGGDEPRRINAVESGSVTAGVAMRVFPRSQSRREVDLSWCGPGIRAYRIVFEGLEAPGASEVPRSIDGVLQVLEWQVTCFPWTVDPREDVDAWREQAAGAEPVTLPALELPYAGGGPSQLDLSPALSERELAPDRFGTLARCEVELPAGEWELRTRSDDGIRVWVDEELLIDDWTWHGPTPHDARFTVPAGGAQVSLRVEHFELDGFALLEVELVPR